MTLGSIIPAAKAAVAPGQVSGFGIKATATPINFNTLVSRIINVVLLVAGILAVIYLVYSGILYITANGDPAKATAARTGIINAIIGIIIILIAFSITTWVTGGIKFGNPNLR